MNNYQRTLPNLNPIAKFRYLRRFCFACVSLVHKSAVKIVNKSPR